MKKLLVSALSLSVLLVGCNQEKNEEPKEETKKEVRKEVVKKDKANDKKSEDAKKKIKNQKEKVTTEQPTTEINNQSIETSSTENVQQNKNQAEVKTNENGHKILGYTPEGDEIVGYTAEGEPILDKMGEQAPPPVPEYTQQQSTSPASNNKIVNELLQTDQSWRNNLVGGLSSGETQMKYLIENGMYSEPDAQERLEAIKYFEQNYGK
ncbi:hypothetical protein [Macrococcoides caseolyticum]|uniref:hypothetical protein n=1 Tax=Macrococcoides caseolyticum TaxID=69966 RepID=UPI001F170056|nr:hypothetical protein [Macrococcus caseolyticus]MCE4956736.1 hypothetical protein [Macrococcus caseolyticus]